MKEPTTAPQRTIPPLPGGGSWRFDEAAWQWRPNDGAAASMPAAASAAAPIAAPAASQPATEE